MYPSIPYYGYSWPITQHAGIIGPNVIKGLLEACLHCNGSIPDSAYINGYLHEHNIVTDNVRADSCKIDAWRDYQQILSELGLIYSTKICKEVQLTPIAVAYIDGQISYEELMTIQLMKYQYPNGFKYDISAGLKKKLGGQQWDNLIQLQATKGVLIRPAVIIWLLLYKLHRQNHIAELSIDEMLKFVVKCTQMSDVDECLQQIINARTDNSFDLPKSERARRNMLDWQKLLSQTPLFCRQGTRFNYKIALTDYSIQNAGSIFAMCTDLSDPGSFWIYDPKDDYRFKWFSFYGDIDVSAGLMPPSAPLVYENNEDGEKDIREESLAQTVKLKPFERTCLGKGMANHKRVISSYDYNKTAQGKRLHDNMINLIAERCVAKGAEVSADTNSVDLFVRYQENEFIIEAKSITPKNFIARLRTAIGQIQQYDYLLKKEDNKIRRMGLAFSAKVPEKSWAIPFVTEYLNMDLITLDAGELRVRSNNELSRSLFSD